MSEQKARGKAPAGSKRALRPIQKCPLLALSGHQTPALGMSAKGLKADLGNLSARVCKRHKFRLKHEVGQSDDRVHRRTDLVTHSG